MHIQEYLTTCKSNWINEVYMKIMNVITVDMPQFINKRIDNHKSKYYGGL